MSTDDYDKLVQKSVIKENYASLTHENLRNDKLIPCELIDNFYYDTLFYLHLHFSLYIELLHFNVKNSFDITAFRSLWNDLKIKFIDQSTTSLTNTISSASYKITGFTISNGGSGYISEPKIIFTPSGSTTSEEIGSATITYGFPFEITSGITSSKNNALTPVQQTHDLEINDIITFNTPDNGTRGIGRIIELNNIGEVTKIEITTRGSGYTLGVAPTVLSIANSSGITKKSILTFASTTIVGYINNAIVSSADKLYTKFGNFSVSAPSSAGGITATVSPISNITSIGYLTTDKNYMFNLNVFNRFYNSTLQYNNEGEKSILVSNRTPRISNISDYPSSSKPTLFSIDTSSEIQKNANYSKQNIQDYNNDRTKKFQNVINDILNQDVNNILGFLAYQVKYYNVIILNTSIQRMIYKYYLNDNNIQLNSVGIFLQGNLKYDNLHTIKDHIDNMKTNLLQINLDSKKINNIFSETTSNYPAKIDKLNINEKDYRKTQEALNAAAKNYNQYYSNYNKLKIYASSIIIFLVILIIVTVVITILPYFNANSKNTYYILILILIIILTILFYNNFSHINLYEKFTIIPNGNTFGIIDCTNRVSYNPNTKNPAQNNAQRANNYDFFNEISKNVSEYNNQYSDLNTQMSSGIYTSDNKVFEQDADNYLNSMYIDKKRKIDLFRIKRTSLINLIEAIKQQIIYLFNIIFIICLLTIVLLFALLLYVNMPQFMSLIIGLVSIAIILIVIYYIYAVVQPTRLIANKNYWANKNPSEETYNKL
jgi:hypothetical protein